MKNIISLPELKNQIQKKGKTLLLLYKNGSEPSEQAIRNLESTEIHSDVSIYYSDVNKVRDIHPEYSITSVPTLLIFEKEKLKNIIKGTQSTQVYNDVIKGGGASTQVKQNGSKSVIVYTSPTCSWCTTLKSYLRQHQIQFKEFDVSTNQDMAKRMMQKSGQMGVPQTEINGNMIVGFDKNKIDKLLEIS